VQGKIFLNYRRGDDPGFTGRLFDRLEDHFPSDQLFMDVDSIEPGLDFVQVLDEQVSRCDVLLAVIGRGWLDATDRTGARRLDNPKDFVRIEIESALGRGIRVIPVLVNEAAMPREQDLPESLKPFARRNAIRLTHEKFRADVAGLVKALDRALAEEAARRVLAEAQATGKDAAKDDAAVERLRIAEAEESANWEFVQRSRNPFDVRDHIARFPQGKTPPEANPRLSRSPASAIIFLSIRRNGAPLSGSPARRFRRACCCASAARLFATRRSRPIGSASSWRFSSPPGR
jgi:hypothetical protein